MELVTRASSFLSVTNCRKTENGNELSVTHVRI